MSCTTINVEEKVAGIIANKTGMPKDQIKSDTPLKDLMDSLTATETGMQIEDECGVEVELISDTSFVEDEKERKEPLTVGEIIKKVEQTLKQKH